MGLGNEPRRLMRHRVARLTPSRSQTRRAERIAVVFFIICSMRVAQECANACSDDQRRLDHAGFSAGGFRGFSDTLDVSVCFYVLKYLWITLAALKSRRVRVSSRGRSSVASGNAAHFVASAARCFASLPPAFFVKAERISGGKYGSFERRGVSARLAEC